MKDMEEVWKPIPGTNRRYEVSSLGRVRSYCGFKTRRGKQPRSLDGRQREGLVTFQIKFRGKTHEIQGAKLVLTAFKGPCPSGYKLMYKDGNRSNIRLENVYWGEDETAAPTTAPRVKSINNRRSDSTIMTGGFVLVPEEIPVFKAKYLSVLHTFQGSKETAVRVEPSPSIAASIEEIYAGFNTCIAEKGIKGIDVIKAEDKLYLRKVK